MQRNQNHNQSELKQLRKDGFQILQNLEDDFRHDLSLHLYSTFLLHLKNPFFPERRWSAWPLPYSEVPDPKNTSTYIDINDVMGTEYENQSEFADTETEEAKKENNDGTSTPTPNSTPAPENPASEGLDEIAKLIPRSHRVFELEERLSDANKNLKIELNSIFQSKIYNQISSLNKGKKTDEIKYQAIIDPNIEIPNLLYEKVKNRINSKIDSLVKMRLTSRTKFKRDTDVIARLYNWRDILMDEGNLEAEKRCRKLFTNIKVYNTNSTVTENTRPIDTEIFSNEEDTEDEYYTGEESDEGTSSGEEIEAGNDQNNTNDQNNKSLLEKFESRKSAALLFDQFKDNILQEKTIFNEEKSKKIPNINITENYIFKLSNRDMNTK
ncbi:hypothetical protein PACTADRAFT_48636 [Pachysolen tannophilus NRRL Y-2460]|uniref:Rrn9 domain-containing protein n=1 Tax=Pachysolen tannophilus NRRL Y-2460 TaxID=669874 RepID=A0A1E4TYL6_PACTA|nr:hypothetical protein PACTADRAFT_48636 [Pachysolen tannophilus NRRL Y-2460]